MLVESYDGADQGYINTVISELKYAPMFNPKGNESRRELKKVIIKIDEVIAYNIEMLT